MARVALFGGTFDPPHNGHIAAATAALKQFKLDEVIFIPTAQSPHKLHQQATPYKFRKLMTELAVADAKEPRFKVSNMESPEKTTGPNYSIDTIGRYKTAHPGDQVFLIIGMDQLASFANWRKPEAILKEAELIVATRPGWDFEQTRQSLPASIQENRQLVSHIHLLDGVYEDISSTELRASIADLQKNGTAMQRLSPSVLDCIREEGLYGSKPIQSE